MRVRPALLFVALAVAALSGCDDRTESPKVSKTDKPAMATVPSALSRAGAGWHAVADAHQSVWSFADRPVPIPGHLLAAQTNAPELLHADDTPDTLAVIRTALMSNTLPARRNIHVEELVNRSIPALTIPGLRVSPAGPSVLLATTPWNDETVLLWVEVPIATEGRSVSVEFDPATVIAFRPLGDPSNLPASDAMNRKPGGVAMLYELQPRIQIHEGDRGNVRYAVLHVVPTGEAPTTQRLDRPITGADAVGTIDNAPEIVRLATAAAGFGELLRGDPAMGDLSCNDMIALAQSVRQPDTDGWRAQLVALMYRAAPLIDAPPRDDTGK